MGSDLCWHLPWSVADTPSVTPLKKTEFSSPRGCQLQIASGRGVGLYAHSPSSMLGYVCLELLHATASCKPICVPSLLHLEGRVLSVTHHLWLLPSLPSFCIGKYNLLLTLLTPCILIIPTTTPLPNSSHTHPPTPQASCSF